MGNDILDIILDKENKENIVLEDSNGKLLEFEQIAVIILGEEDKKLYVILRPVDKIEEINEGEAIVFRVDSYGDGHALIIEENEETVREVFKQYYKLLEEAGLDISGIAGL